MRMQSKPMQPIGRAIVPIDDSGTVVYIAYQGMIDVAQMESNLVKAAGLYPAGVLCEIVSKDKASMAKATEIALVSHRLLGGRLFALGWAAHDERPGNQRSCDNA